MVIISKHYYIDYTTFFQHLLLLYIFLSPPKQHLLHLVFPISDDLTVHIRDMFCTLSNTGVNIYVRYIDLKQKF